MFQKNGLVMAHHVPGVIGTSIKRLAAADQVIAVNHRQGG